MNEGDLLRIDELGEELFESFWVVAGDDDMFLVLEKEFDGSQKNEFVAEVSVGPISDDEDGLSFDREVGVDVHCSSRES